MSSLQQIAVRVAIPLMWLPHGRWLSVLAATFKVQCRATPAEPRECTARTEQCNTLKGCITLRRGIVSLRRRARNGCLQSALTSPTVPNGRDHVVHHNQSAAPVHALSLAQTGVLLQLCYMCGISTRGALACDSIVSCSQQDASAEKMPQWRAVQSENPWCE